MHILNIEDDAIKHNDICQTINHMALKNLQIDWVNNLEDAIKTLQDSIAQNPYDLIITDMWYPQNHGCNEVESGKVLIETVQKHGWNIPIIICSSVRYRYPEILGAVHYSSSSYWEDDLTNLIKTMI